MCGLKTHLVQRKDVKKIVVKVLMGYVDGICGRIKSKGTISAEGLCDDRYCG